MRKLLLWGLIGGMVYYSIEGLWRLIFTGDRPHFSMFAVGGLCFVLVGGINQIPWFYNLSIRWQALIGTAVVLLVEFISGYILNIKLGLGIWDYSHMPFNWLGQICPYFAVLWLLLMPTAIWLEDWLRYKFYGELWPGCKDEKMYTWAEAYKELIFGRRKQNAD